jgi:Spy/CpxP family protein refolding chaperone
MTSLTEEQKAQIAEIHRKAVEEKKQIEQREEAAILAVLNDAQRTEAEGLKAKAKMKKPAAGEPAAATPATAEKAG